MTTYLDVRKASTILSKISDEYAVIENIDNQLENLKTEHNITKNLDAYCAFSKNDKLEQLARVARLAKMTLSFGLDFESAPLEEFCKFLFPFESMDIQKLHLTIKVIDLLSEKQQHFAEVISLEAEISTIKYFEDLAYEVVAPMIRTEYGVEVSNYDF